MLGGSEAAWESALPDGDCANGCGDGEAGSGVLSKDGRNRADKPSKPTLIIPARMRRRFTRSSKIVPSDLPLQASKKNSTSKPPESKRRSCQEGSSTHLRDIRRPRSSKKLVAEVRGSVVRRDF